jgi:hypothetical protein
MQMALIALDCILMVPMANLTLCVFYHNLRKKIRVERKQGIEKPQRKSTKLKAGSLKSSTTLANFS